jgi:predicted MPP superfamily phosphohydrolase
MGTVVPLGFEVTDMLVEEHRFHPFNLVMHVGDVAYAGVSSQDEGEYEPVWDVYMNQIMPLAQVVPYQVGVGNHEHYYNYLAFNNRFSMPGNTTGGNGNFWFSFDYANAHVVSISTEHDWDADSVQYQWIEEDMASARQRNEIKWLFFAGHRPLLCSDQAEYDSHNPTSPMITTFQPLFVKYKVDMVLTGHMHCYERTYPTLNGQVVGAQPGQNTFVNPQAPIYITQGTSGAMIIEEWVDPQPVWSANRQQEYGFGRMDISTYANGTTMLHYQFLGQSYPVTLLDEFFIVKEP